MKRRAVITLGSAVPYLMASAMVRSTPSVRGGQRLSELGGEKRFGRILRRSTARAPFGYSHPFASQIAFIVLSSAFNASTAQSLFSPAFRWSWAARNSSFAP
jgi:hypothetical protein